MAKDLKKAKSLKEKSLGLLVKSSPRSLLLKTRFGIHTFFLKEPIDIAVLSSSLKVVKLGTAKPNSIYIYNPAYSTIIELPSGTIKRSMTKVGDRLEIKLDL